MPPNEVELARLVDAALARRPSVDGHRLTEALEALCAARDGCDDPVRRERLSLVITLVMGVKHPLGPPPWEALAQARALALPARA